MRGPLSLLLASSLSAALIAAPATAQTIRGEQDGIHFEYSMTLKENDKIQFDGVYLNTRERFRMVLSAGGSVRGNVGPRPVRFSVAPEKRNRLVAQLRSRHQVALSHAGTASRLGD